MQNRSIFPLIFDSFAAAPDERFEGFVLNQNQTTSITHAASTPVYIWAVGADAAAPAWAESTAYTVGQFVTEGGLEYECIRAHTAAAGDDADGAPDQDAATAWRLRDDLRRAAVAVS